MLTQDVRKRRRGAVLQAHDVGWGGVTLHWCLETHLGEGFPKSRVQEAAQRGKRDVPRRILRHPHSAHDFDQGWGLQQLQGGE